MKYSIQLGYLSCALVIGLLLLPLVAASAGVGTCSTMRNNTNIVGHLNGGFEDEVRRAFPDVEFVAAGQFRNLIVECRGTVSPERAIALCVPSFSVGVSYVDARTVAFKLNAKLPAGALNCSSYQSRVDSAQLGYPQFLGDQIADPDGRSRYPLLACLRVKVQYGENDVAFLDDKNGVAKRMGRQELHKITMANIEGRAVLSKLQQGQDFVGQSHALSVADLDQATDVRLDLTVARDGCADAPLRSAVVTTAANTSKGLICYTPSAAHLEDSQQVYMRTVGPPKISAKRHPRVSIARLFGAPVLKFSWVFAQDTKQYVYVKRPVALQVGRDEQLSFSVAIRVLNKNCSCCLDGGGRRDLLVNNKVGGINFTAKCSCPKWVLNDAVCPNPLLTVTARNAWGASEATFRGCDIFTNRRKRKCGKCSTYT